MTFRRALAVEFALALGGSEAVAALLRHRAGVLQSREHVPPCVERASPSAVSPASSSVSRLRVGGLQARQFLPRAGAFVFQPGVKFVPEVRVQQAQLARQRLMPPRLCRLSLERPELLFDLADHVGQARQVRLGVFELARGFLALALVFGDAGGFLEDRASVLRPRRQNQVDLALLHDGVSRTPDTGIHEKLLDVAQPAERPVEQIFAAPVAVHAPRDADLVIGRAKLLLAIGERHGDFRHADGLPRIRAVEDHIRHLAAPEGLGRLLTQAPADRVEHVALTAAVRPHDRRHPVRENSVRSSWRTT